MTQNFTINLLLICLIINVQTHLYSAVIFHFSAQTAAHEPSLTRRIHTRGHLSRLKPLFSFKASSNIVYALLKQTALDRKKRPQDSPNTTNTDPLILALSYVVFFFLQKVINIQPPAVVKLEKEQTGVEFSFTFT